MALTFLTNEDRDELERQIKEVGDSIPDGQNPPYIASDEPPEDTSVIWVKTGVVEDSNGVNIPGGAKVGQTIVVKAVDENGKPTEWEAVDMPEVPEQANADWNQNDPKAPGYVENRPFYTELEFVEVHPAQDIDFNWQTNGNATGFFYFDGGTSFLDVYDAGTRVKMVVDGTEYDFTIKSTAYDDKYIGNAALISADNEDTGESFYVYKDGWDACGIVTNKPMQTYNVTISVEAVTVHQIPAKYVSDAITEALLTENTTYIAQSFTESTNAVKTAQTFGGNKTLTQPKEGVMVNVFFTQENRASNPSLDINRTGAKSIVARNGSAVTASALVKGMNTFVYHDNKWYFLS